MVEEGQESLPHTQSTRSPFPATEMKKRFSCILSLLALPLMGGAQVSILNPSFEASTVGPDSGAVWDTIIDDWFMESHDGATFAANNAEVAQRRNVNNMPVVPDGNQWANLVGADAGIYQALSGGALASFQPETEYTLSLTVSQRSNQPFHGVTIALYSGNVTGANNTDLGTLGATLLDSVTIAQNVFTAAGVAENYVVPAFTLNTGTTGISGEQLWLRISTTGDGHHLVDDISIIPEPSTYAALFGLGALALCLYRRRRAKL